MDTGKLKSTLNIGKRQPSPLARDYVYEFRVMPFGLCNAPSIFQRLMELVLAGLRWDICLAYLDDIVVFGHTFEKHLQRLRIVLSRLWDANLKLNLKKCQFSFNRVVSFLGHVISRH